MTETPNANDQAERLRRLQERRAASGRSSRAADCERSRLDARPRPSRRRTRRRHPAAATRILLAGLSVTSFFSVASAIAVANRRVAASPRPVAAVDPVDASRRARPSTAATPAAQAAGLPRNAVVHTDTRAEAEARAP